MGAELSIAVFQSRIRAAIGGFEAGYHPAGEGTATKAVGAGADDCKR